MVCFPQLKGTLKGREEITSEVVGQAYVENTALKLFLYADTQDRNAVFNK